MEEVFEDESCPPLPLSSLPKLDSNDAILKNVTNLVKTSTGAFAQRAKPQQPRFEDSAAVSSAAVLRRLADEYAALQQRGDPVPEPQLWGLWHRARVALDEDNQSASRSRATAIEAIRDLVMPYVPVVNGCPTSIGSIPNASGCVACRFYKKDKCFDGVLCRFSHIPTPNAPKKEKRSKRNAAPPPDKVDQTPTSYLPVLGGNSPAALPFTRRMTMTRLPRLPSVPELAPCEVPHTAPGAL
jgi:hypothetical protein